jgi:hypothetical protein
MLLVGLITIVVVGLFYLAIPKYQVEIVRLDDKTVMITKIEERKWGQASQVHKM